MDTKKKRSFNRLLGKLSRKPRTFFLQYPKLKENLLFKTRFASECSYGRKECCFNNPTETSFTKSRQFFNQCPQVMKFFSPNLFFNKVLFLDTCNAVLTKLLIFFSKKCRKIFAHWSTMIRNDIFFPTRTFFLTKFLWIRRMCFWQLHRPSQQIDESLSPKIQRW